MQTIGEIYIAEKTIKRLNIPRSNPAKVRVGANVVNADLVIKENVPGQFKLSPDLARALHLDSSKDLRIRYDRDNEIIHIGPMVGILVDYLPNQEEYEPKSVQAEMIYLSTLGRRLPAQFFVFTPGGINWGAQTVKGFVWRNGGLERGRWSGSVYPIPDVIYDRITTRVAQARSKATRKKLMGLPYVYYFNPSFLNKWRVHEFLVQNSALSSYLPETRLLNQENLPDMAQKYKTLYLKPGNGSLGNRIIKVNVNSPNYNYTIYNHGRRSGQAGSIADLLQRTRSTRGKRAYIVQQGIDLDTYFGSPFDMRIIMQKDGEGKWLISKKFVRVAPRGSSIANLSRGGTAETSARVLNKIFAGNKTLIKEKNEELRKLCQMTAETLEVNSQNIYGELGLDIGIDKKGKLWIIEVNSKPRKTTVTSLSQAIVRNTFRRPLLYAIYLSGFRRHR